MELGDHCGSDDLYVNDERIPVSREVFRQSARRITISAIWRAAKSAVCRLGIFCVLAIAFCAPGIGEGFLRILTVLTIRHFSWISEMWKRK